MKEAKQCPACGSTKFYRKGKTKAGNPRRQCKTCGKNWTESSASQGRPTVGDRPMTDVERAARYRDRIKHLNEIVEQIIEE